MGLQCRHGVIVYRKELPVGALIGGGTLDLGQAVHDYAQVNCPLLPATKPKSLVSINLIAIKLLYIKDVMKMLGGHPL